MNVKELREALEEVPDDIPVYIYREISPDHPYIATELAGVSIPLTGTKRFIIWSKE
jgi:hypothetical protein